MTADQLFAISAQLHAMAETAETKRRETTPGSPEAIELANARQSLTAASSTFLTASLTAALDELAPHVDAMLSTLQDLDREATKQRSIARVLQILDSALAISAAAAAGDPAAVLKALGNVKL